jgi:8-oxo-dGTP diphosphatase
MITCTFEKGHKASLRHIVTHAIVEKSGCLLLVKRSPDIIEPGKWALPGGFLDRDETLEAGVLRELREETGWDGVVVSLFRINSNPNRPREDRQNVAFEYIIKPLREIGKSDKESTQVEWIPMEKLPPLDQMAFDHGKTIQLYLRYRETAFPLPLTV